MGWSARMIEFRTAIEALSTSQDALRAVEFLCGISVLLQSLENLKNLAEIRETGTFRWSLMREEVGGLPAPIRGLLDWVMALHMIHALYLAQCVCALLLICLLYTSPSPRDLSTSRMPSSA